MTGSHTPPKKQSKPIVYARGLSAFAIFACHIAFIAGAFELSMWLNFGVPVFFIISAYLLSLKPNLSKNYYSFYKRRISSIYPKYLIYIFAVSCALLIVKREPDINSILCYSLGLSGFTNSCILGLGHLWFISVLLVCYLITPLLYRICKITSKNTFLIYLIALLIILFVVTFFADYPSYAIHIGSFICVYCFYNRHSGIVTKKQIFWYSLVAIILAIIRLLLDSHIKNGDYTTYYYYDAYFQPISRLFLALSLFAVFIYNSEKIVGWSERHEHLDKALTGFSSISYEVYLTHQFILLALWEFIPSLYFGVGLIVWSIVSFVLTILNSLVLLYLYNKFTQVKNIIISKSW